MHPVLFSIGRFTISSFGVMMALAFIAGGWVAHWQFKKRGVKPDFVYGIIIVAVIGGILGAKIHYLIIHPDEWPSNLWSGRGLVWFGGMFGALLAAAILTLVSKQRLMAVADSAGFAMALGYAVGRVGCFLVGDDYGKPTNLPWGIAFPKGSPPTTVPVHPTQLYEILASLVIFALMVWAISPHVKREGMMFFIYLLLAGFERFMVEFVRTNPVVALGLTQQQFISIALFVLGGAGLWWFGRHGKLVADVVQAAAKARATGGQGSAAGAKADVKSSAKTVARPVQAAPKPAKVGAKQVKPPVRPDKRGATPPRGGAKASKRGKKGR